MVSRQHGVHRAVIKYGSAYVIVLPGVMAAPEEQAQNVPVIRPISPRRMTAFYADEVDDEWPQFAIEVNVIRLPNNTARLMVYVYDEQNRYILTGNAVADPTQAGLKIADPGDILLNGQPVVSTHGLGMCPVVRYLYETDLDGEDDCVGEIEPLMPIQDQINFDTFNLMISTQFAAFRQRWVAGMSPVDEEGNESQPFRPGVDRVWASDDSTTHFGEFGETALQPYSLVREDGIRHMSTISQVPPYHLLGQVANMSAEALAAARDGLDRKIEELQASMTDPWRNVFRLSALAGGNKDGWDDLFGTVVWRDTSARAFGSTIDGLTKLAQMLGVPAEELWARVPGATADDVASWQLAAQREKAQMLVAQMVAQQAGTQAIAPVGVPQPAAPAVAPGVPPGVAVPPPPPPVPPMAAALLPPSMVPTGESL
jgi:hypothetical protein